MMKHFILLYLSVALVLSAAVSCKKDVKSGGTAGLTIVNAIPDCPRMLAHLSWGQPKRWAEVLFVDFDQYDPADHLSLPAGEQPLQFYRYPDTTVSDKPVHKMTIPLVAGDISTLFLMGTFAQPETMLVTKTPPYYSSKDSLVGLRLANLSPGTAPVRVKITGQGVNMESTSLTYKGITDYISVPATSKVADLLVEFYDQTSGTLLAAYKLDGVGSLITNNRWRYRNYTLALIKGPGAKHPGAAQFVTLINDY
ncbi:DUF4397 domain-containing protein [Pedobacter caeni]|uniref:DUF4397 domain-containing protein n=1 Tax=Pedobacter caeni TaxID=288992 RepID=A0A1M5DEE1_9SPHI|nr:DUF4397 domain-containing protein [Pedobacter caeni]SHF65204.1 hypothetical protein SAMN04488522_103192 [Pedobacter caeni]